MQISMCFVVKSLLTKRGRDMCILQCELELANNESFLFLINTVRFEKKEKWKRSK